MKLNEFTFRVKIVFALRTVQSYYVIHYKLTTIQRTLRKLFYGKSVDAYYSFLKSMCS